MISTKNVEAFRQAIASGADINEVRGFSVLEKAIHAGQVEMVKLLLDAGADPSLGSKGALLAAYSARSQEVIDLLFARGVDPSNWPGALRPATQWSAEAALQLLSRGIPFEPQTVLLAASARGSEEARTQLIERAIAASTAPQEFLSALIATRSDLPRARVEQLLAKGASLTPKAHPSPLHEAVLQALIQPSQVLLELGASLDTPLAVAWEYGGKTWSKGLTVREAYVEFVRFDLRGRDPGKMTQGRKKLLEKVAKELGIELALKKQVKQSRDPSAPVKVRGGWRRFHHADGKFWEVRAVGEYVRTRWGKVGLDGRSASKLTDSAAEAKREAAKAIAAKLKEGYVEVTGG